MSVSIPQLCRWMFRAATATDWSGESNYWDLNEDTVGLSQQVLYGRGLKGNRGRLSSRARYGVQQVGGSISADPSPALMARLLPFMTGKASSPFAPQATLTEFDMLVDRVADIILYSDLKVAGWTLSGSSGLLDLSLDIVGGTRTKGQSWPSGKSLGATAAFSPYVATDVTLEVNSTEYNIEQWSLSVSEGVRPKYRNSLTALNRPEGERVIQFGFLPPFDSTNASALWSQFVAGVDDIAVQIAIENGSVSDTIDLEIAHFDDVDPVVDNDDEIMLPMGAMICTGSFSNAELTWTNDSTI